MPINQDYVAEIRRELSYSATWLPNVPLNLGDVGILGAAGFQRRTSLETLGIPFTFAPPGPAASIAYSSKGKTQMEYSGAANIPTGISPVGVATKLTITFLEENGVLFIADEYVSQAIQDLDALGEALLARSSQGKWKKGYVVITEVVRPKAATIVISAAAQAEIKFALNTALFPQATGISLLDVASSKLNVESSHGVGLNLIAQQNLTPLFRAFGIEQRWVGGPSVGEMTGRNRILRKTRFDIEGMPIDEDPRREETVFVEVTYPTRD